MCIRDRPPAVADLLGHLGADLRGLAVERDRHGHALVDLRQRVRRELDVDHRAGDGDDPTVLELRVCLLYTSPSPRDRTRSRMPSSA